MVDSQRDWIILLFSSSNFYRPYILQILLTDKGMLVFCNPDIIDTFDILVQMNVLPAPWLRAAQRKHAIAFTPPGFVAVAWHGGREQFSDGVGIGYD